MYLTVNWKNHKEMKLKNPRRAPSDLVLFCFFPVGFCEGKIKE